MKLSHVPSLDATLSKLGFGAMRLPEKDGAIDQEQVNRMVKHAFDHGVNYFDTAYVYGDGASELALGTALQQLDRSKFYLADKMPFWSIGENHLDACFQTSLDRLQTDYIDFYLLHCMGRDTYGAAKQLDAIKWAVQKKKEGKIRHLGFSIHDDYEFLLEILGDYDWDFAQIQFNYLDLQDKPGLAGYEELTRRNIPIVIMEPLKGGALADIPDHIAAPFRALGGSNVSYAFRWLAEKPGIVTILSGMSTLAQVEDNVRVFADIAPLSEAEHAAINQVEQNIKSTQKVPCTGCRYCMPCPMGVMIPDQFKAWNTQAMQPKSGNWISGAAVDAENAALCVSCGACMTHCPQHINIPEKLRELAAGK